MDGNQLPKAALQGLKVVDSDTHLSEPHDLWTSRVPASWKTRVPHVRIGEKGRESWFIDEDKILQKKTGASSVVRKDGSKDSFWDWDIRGGLTLKDVTPASYDAKARVQLMDQLGVWGQIIYGNVPGFGAHHLAKIDPEVSKVTVQVYNDALAEFQQDSGDRCFPQALVPFWDIKLAVQEVERASRELKLKGITMCAEPHANPALPPLHDRHWDPLWEACSALDMPINFHVGSSDFSVKSFLEGAWPGLDSHRKLVVGASQLELYNARILANLLTCDLLPRFPKTKWVMVESGLCWIPFILERLEWQLMDTPFGKKGLDQPGPRELFHNQVYACFWFEQAAPSRLLDIIGFDNVLFETDFPHPTCLYPGGVEHGLKVLEPWGEEVQRKVMGGNAARLYNLPA